MKPETLARKARVTDRRMRRAKDRMLLIGLLEADIRFAQVTGQGQWVIDLLVGAIEELKNRP